MAVSITQRCGALYKGQECYYPNDHDGPCTWEFTRDDLEPVLAEPESVVDWWAEVAQDDAEAATAKLGEYGSRDLIEIGRAMARVTGGSEDKAERQLAELGVYFYLVGKVARMTEAYAQGRMPSDDTLKDLVTYGMMIRRIRATGEWR